MIDLTRATLMRFLAALLVVTFVTPLPAETKAPAAETPETAVVEPAAEEPAAGKFLRVVRDEAGDPTALETAIVRYVAESEDDELVVELVAVVHVGERNYYRKLDKHFEQYDVLLYELVAPEGTRIERGARDNPLAGLLKNTLKLESQIERIDYGRKNFVHADLSPQEMGEKMRERGESGWTMALSIFADLMKQQNAQEARRRENPDRRVPEVSLATLLFDPRGPLKMKRMMAEQFDDLDVTGGLGGTLNQMLIIDRNQAAMKVLREQLDKGHKRIGIFYGAAHMPDFEERLLKDFGLKRDSEEWLTAWDLEG